LVPLSQPHSGAAPAIKLGSLSNRSVFRRSFPGPSLRLSKSDAFACPIFVDKFDSRSFKRLPNGSFVRSRNRNLSLNHFHAADRCYSDF